MNATHTTIAPTAITNFNRTQDELETFWIFSILVAGKDSDQTSRKVGQLLSRRGELSPFEYLRLNENAIHNLLVANKVGQYGRIERALRESLNLDLRTASVAELMNVFGVGAKSARFFVLHSRSNCDCAVLDVHILRWMRKRGIETPEQTPSGKKYLELERVFLALIRGEFPNVPVAQVDLLIWATESGRITQEFAANECECCETGNQVEYIAEQSYDQGKTRNSLRICGMCAEYWNDGSAWDAACVKISK